MKTRKIIESSILDKDADNFSSFYFFKYIHNEALFFKLYTRYLYKVHKRHHMSNKYLHFQYLFTSTVTFPTGTIISDL